MAVRPVIVENDDQLSRLLRGRRLALDITQAELNDRCGFPDAYLGKIEASTRSYGRRVAWGLAQTLFYWMDALGLRLVLMDRESAEALVAQSPDPAMDEIDHRPYANRERSTPLRQETMLMTRLRFRAAA